MSIIYAGNCCDKQLMEMMVVHTVNAESTIASPTTQRALSTPNTCTPGLNDMPSRERSESPEIVTESQMEMVNVDSNVHAATPPPRFI